MDAELKRRVEALRRPLELAAADGFAGVRTVRGLGHALRAACDGVLARAAGDAISGLEVWRTTLGRWEELDEQQQAIEVARGMRLLARLPRPAAAPPAARPTFTLPPLPDDLPVTPVEISAARSSAGASPGVDGAPRRDGTPVESSAGIAPVAPVPREVPQATRSLSSDGAASRSHASAEAEADGGARRSLASAEADGGTRRSLASAAAGAAPRTGVPARRAGAEPVTRWMAVDRPMRADTAPADRLTQRAGAEPVTRWTPVVRAASAPAAPSVEPPAPLTRPAAAAFTKRLAAPERASAAAAPSAPVAATAAPLTRPAAAASTKRLAAPERASAAAAPSAPVAAPTAEAALLTTPVAAPGAAPAAPLTRPAAAASTKRRATPERASAAAAPSASSAATAAPLTTPAAAASAKRRAGPEGASAAAAPSAPVVAPTAEAALLTTPVAAPAAPLTRPAAAASTKRRAAPARASAAAAPSAPVVAPTAEAALLTTPVAAPGVATAAPLTRPAAAASTKRRAGPEGASAAPAPEDPLATPTTSLPGIGPAFAERLGEKGLTTVEDLVWLVPRRYDDVRGARPLTEAIALPDGERATLTARVASARMVFGRGRRWAEVRLVNADDSPPATATVRWFNVFAGIDKRMPPGSRVTLSGVLRARGGRAELANPDILAIEQPASGAPAGPAASSPPAILARYPEIAGVPPGRLRSACAAACARVAGCAEDGVPAVVEAAAGLPGLAETLARLHAPPPDIAAEDLAAMNRGDSRWHRRLAFGELFALGVAITLRRRERRGDAAVPCPRDPELAAALGRALPFALTGAQRRAITEIAGDLARDTPMNRLLQGDVGAGKTAVAFAAALQAARAGRQTAVMAPTELLAEQHAETWRTWARAVGLRLELVTASTPRGVRASLLALAAGGALDVLIGTHALLAEAVGFHALGLVVIDEQHRFGVAQRARLRDKGDGQGAPHLLVMTATPIPRTLALTAYGDLDVSVLDELPPGRSPVATRVLSGARGQAAAYKLIGERIAAGERAYVVFPKVAPDEAVDGALDGDSRAWKDATTGAAEVAAALPGARVGLVHGRLDGAARDAVMRAFKAGEVDVLVATTVIEVGVDVPAATVMVIHDAERFGLAQLHQLRGRVGRGGGAAHCVLVSHGPAGEDARRRLDAMVATHDGFRIAEEDLALRGPGELLGPKQAGVPRLRFGDLAQHTELLLEARRHAEAVLEADPALARPEHAALRRALARRMARSVYGAESG